MYYKLGYSRYQAYARIAMIYGCKIQEVCSWLKPEDKDRPEFQRIPKEIYDMDLEELKNIDPQDYGWANITELLLHYSDLMPSKYDWFKFPVELSVELGCESDELEELRKRWFADHPDLSYEGKLKEVVKFWRKRGKL